jgi:dihydroorotate dehydrogenase
MSRYTLAGIAVTSPIVSAAGVMNGTDIEDIKSRFNRALDTELGVITLGSYTIPPRGGNEAEFGPPVYFYDAKAGKAYNSMGLANIGKDKALKLLPEFLKKAHDRNKVVIHSVSPSIEKEYGTSVEQAMKLVGEFLEAGADLVEVNLSCPNVVSKGGGRKPMMGLDIISLMEFFNRIAKEFNSIKKIGFKMPPYLTSADQRLIPKIARMIQELDIGGFITVSNTIPNQIPRNKMRQPILSVPEGKAGMSGPATKNVGREQLKLWAKALKGKRDIISLLGVDSAAEVEWRLNNGARASGGVTFLRETSNWPKTVSSMMARL